LRDECVGGKRCGRSLARGYVGRLESHMLTGVLEAEEGVKKKIGTGEKCTWEVL